MRYLLVVGFACDVYRREPRARIFVGDKLIDEFLVSHEKDKLTNTQKKWKNNNINNLQPVSYIDYINEEIKTFPTLRFYEIDLDNTQSQVELRIDIKNSDSNYTNGFMTASTLLKLQVCHFFPLNKKLISRLVKFRKKNYINKNYAWYVSNRNKIFRLLDNGVMQWYSNKKEIKTDLSKDNFYKIGGHYSIGVDGYFSGNLIKKYGFFVSKMLRPYRYNLFGTPTIDYFLNKYEQHANQRNTD